MKKKIKKLGLSRETVRHLQAAPLARVAGGGGCTQEFETTCVCTDACDSNPTGGTAFTCYTQCNCTGCQSGTQEIWSGCASNCG
jgi:hypothetical protein